MSSKKPAKDKSNEAQSTQTQTSVLRLYETGNGAGGCSDDHFEAEGRRKSSMFHVRCG